MKSKTIRLSDEIYKKLECISKEVGIPNIDDFVEYVLMEIADASRQLEADDLFEGFQEKMASLGYL
jgi:predicted DNA-binding protein